MIVSLWSAPYINAASFETFKENQALRLQLESIKTPPKAPVFWSVSKEASEKTHHSSAVVAETNLGLALLRRAAIRSSANSSSGSIVLELP